LSYPGLRLEDDSRAATKPRIDRRVREHEYDA